MDSLEKYLIGEHPSNLRDINEIESLLGAVVKAYAIKFSNTAAWPYEIRLNEDMELSGTISVSTTSMILAALLRYYGYYHEADRDGLGNVPKGNVLPFNAEHDDKILTNIQTASTLLLEKIYTDNPDEKLNTFSGTFGDNDVFTHAWLSEVCKADWTALQAQEKRWGNVRNLIIKKAISRLPKENKQLLKMEDLFTPQKNGEKITSRPLDHAFTVLRLIQTIRRIEGRDYGALTEYYGYFEKILHEQLSFSSIPDSRFDPAEMMFCLEGMLLCQKNVVDKTLFERVLEVLTSVQRDSAYWRPVKPYLATSQGLVLFPISVEVANSLLRCCSIIDENEIHDTYGSRCILLLRRYWQWLRARAVRFLDKDNKKIELVGWHSEHVNEPTVIHLWETSQVMEFLISYRNALHLHIARTTLVHSRFNKTEPAEAINWEKISKQFEPVLGLGDALHIYDKIDVEFIEPRKTDANRDNISYSMLLYGPPGTGKTTVAENIAKGLGYRLITITVSDFLAGGGAQVEARAKNIFDVIMAQPSCVVLFDEIDHFLLNRDSEHYRLLDTVFQFMTPGMLTKINELRRSKRALFIIATNYEDRIDPAIKRTGRIDHKYLVLPPSKARRISMLDVLQTKNKVKDDEPTTYIFGEQFAGSAHVDNLADASLFLGFKDLEAVVNIAKRKDPVSIADLLTLLYERARTTSLESYRQRFYVGAKEKPELSDSSETPIAEFICLVALYLESRNQMKMNKQEIEAVKSVVGIIRKEMNTQTEIKSDLICRYAPQLKGKAAEDVANFLQSIQ